MITRDCNECQAEYLAEPRYLNRGQGLFCSKACAAKNHSKKRRIIHTPNVTCAWCGIAFYRKPSSLHSKSGKYYCSREHQNLAVTEHYHRTGPSSLSTRTPSLCLHCNLPVSRGAKMHPQCRTAQSIGVWLSGDNSITLNHSRTTGKPVDTKPWVKKYLLETRGDRCEECGFDKHGPDGSIIQMDHVNGNCFDNRPENLKLLCPNCHAMTPTYGSRNKGSGRSHRRKNS